MNPMSPYGWFSRRRTTLKQAPTSRLARPVLRVESGLRFTEILILGALMLAYVGSIAQPLFGVQLHQSIFAHLPLALLGPLLMLHLCGSSFNRDTPKWSNIVSACWPLLALGLFALAGSSFAKWELNITETYLAFGIYLLLIPFYIALGADSCRARSWAYALMTIGLLISLAALAGELARRSSGVQLHEIQYIVIGGFFAIYYASRNLLIKLLMFALIVAVAILNEKLTGYLVGIFAILHILLTAGWRRLPANWRGLYGIAALMFVAVTASTIAIIYVEFREYLPSGNPQVRFQQYGAALQQFAQSPLWGHAYLQGSGEVYTEGSLRLNIPTHSDILDLLKHGGLIAFGLFFLGYWKLFKLIHQAVKLTRADQLLQAYFLSVRFFQVMALLTFTFNPLLLKGPFLIVIWANLGIAAGIALNIRSRQAEAAV